MHFTLFLNSIRERLSERETVFRKVSREANYVSHGLARLGRVEGRTAVWLHDVPTEIAEAMNSDRSHPDH